MKCIFFGATWCAPCGLLKVVYDRIAESTEGVEFVKVDIDEEPELATAMNIKSIPTIIFKKDDEVVDTIVGMVNEKELSSRINKHLRS